MKVKPIQQIYKRDRTLVPFLSHKIRDAIAAAFTATDTVPKQGQIESIVDDVIASLERDVAGGIPGIELIQDNVERVLIDHRLHAISKQYILYRAEHAEMRNQLKSEQASEAMSESYQNGFDPDLRSGVIDSEYLKAFIQKSTRVTNDRYIETVIREMSRGLFDGINHEQMLDLALYVASSLIERDVDYDTLAVDFLLRKLLYEMSPDADFVTASEQYNAQYRENFRKGIRRGVEEQLLIPVLEEKFDIEELAEFIEPANDHLFLYLGMQSLYSRYLLRIDGKCIESIQAFWMRVAMGLAINEKDPTGYAKEFYRVMSSLSFVPSTPTLFHSGLMRPQLSSCYITTVGDDLKNIFKCIGDNAQLSKWSGGVGNDWSNIRGTGAFIKSTKVQSQGVIPFLKIANDTTVAINRSGKRRGATCAYLETWHYDIEEFIDLRKNTGDERRRTHDMSIACWIPDLFMKRVKEGGTWTLFSPEEVPDLHHIYGKHFDARYIFYEGEVEAGNIRLYKQLPAQQLWRKILTRLYETGHPWITFKDPCNIRSPQDHDGVIHSSNLCTEITLNTSSTETAVCNLGSINLRNHCSSDGMNEFKLRDTIRTAMRMLDNVIDINFYPTQEAQDSNLRHRPVGLGMMGLQDSLYLMRIPMDSDDAVEFSDRITETISYYAILSSSELAAERGSYESYKDSKWDRNILPLDTIRLLEEERGCSIDVNREERLDWHVVRENIAKHGMRNSNTMAVAPTATIANIAGCFPCSEPIYKNMYVKSNMSGEFTVVNRYLIHDLKQIGLWNDTMLEQLKYYDGNVSLITNIPEELKILYKEVFDIDPIHHMKIIAVQSKWIDQSQSHNVFLRTVSGKRLHEVYMAAWEMGLKTTYYLRTLGATQIEKSTLSAGKYGYTQKRVYGSM